VAVILSSAQKDFTEYFRWITSTAYRIINKAKVDRRLHLGGSFVCHQAITVGQIDAYIEYTGTAFTADSKPKANADPKAVFQQVKTVYAKQFGLEVTQPLGLKIPSLLLYVVQMQKAFQYSTLSAAQYTPQWQAGFFWIMNGFQDYLKLMGWFAKSPVCGFGFIYRALIQKQIDLTAGNSTDGQIPD